MFENDTACDWVMQYADLNNADGLKLVEAAIAAALAAASPVKEHLTHDALAASQEIARLNGSSLYPIKVRSDVKQDVQIIVDFAWHSVSRMNFSPPLT